jgi:hypothetical protein
MADGVGPAKAQDVEHEKRLTALRLFHGSAAGWAASKYFFTNLRSHYES